MAGYNRARYNTEEYNGAIAAAVAPSGPPTTGGGGRRISIARRRLELILLDVLLIPAIADRWREVVVPWVAFTLGLASRLRSPVTAWAAELGSLSVTLAGGGRTRAGHAPRASRIWEEEDALLLGIEPVIE